MQRGAWPACKKQTAFLLRLADFCFAPRRVLAKTGALRQTQLPVSSTGRGRCVCPCFASAVSAAGSARLRSRPPLAVPLRPAAAVLLRLANFPCGRRCALAKIGALRQLRLAASAAGSARLSCPLSGGSGPLTASFTAAPPGGLFAQNFAAHRQDLDSHPPAHRGVPLSLRDIPLRGISAVTSPSPSSFAGIVKCKAL